MAAQVILTFREGVLEVPAEVREYFHLTEGSRLRLTLGADTPATLEPERTAPATKRGWRSFEGFLKNIPARDTSEIRAAERAWELAYDERKYGFGRE